MKNLSINATAKELLEKNTNLREQTGLLMTRWEEESFCGEKIHSASTMFFNHSEYCLVTGQYEVKCFVDYELHDVDVNEYEPFWDAVSMEELRGFLKVFPVMVEEIEKQMNGNLNIEFDFLK